MTREGDGGRGLFRRRTIWLPTWRGWLLILVLMLAAGGVLVFGAYPFLAVNAPFSDGPVVMEGWVQRTGFVEAIAAARRNHASKIYVTGGAILTNFPVPYKSLADAGRWNLIQMGVPEEEVEAIPTPEVGRDRTFAEAVALRQWMEAHGGPPPRFTLVSMGPHARRSRLLYAKAFGPATQVGIIAASDPAYDPHRWWVRSAGVRALIDELIAYIYVRIFFWKAAA